MSDRIDALGKRPARLQAFTGDVLGGDEDEPLQALVTEAAESLNAPIALVSLILEHVQMFRAQHGLPDDLAEVRATDRDVSFCQLVVRDGEMLEVNDASHDHRVPQDLVSRYGIEAYLGAPIEVNGEVLGSLCVLDVSPRPFSEAERALLTTLAHKASVRLTALSDPVERSLLDRAATPAFAEIRNLLMPARTNVSMALVAAAELAPLARLARLVNSRSDIPAAGALVSAGAALERLRECLTDVDVVLGDLQSAVLALESASVRASGDAHITEVIEAADALAHHHTKMVGGIAWHGLVPGLLIRTPRHTAIALVAAALSMLAGQLRDVLGEAGIRGTIEARQDGVVTLELASDELGARQVSRVLAPLANLLPDGTGPTISRDDDVITITL